MAELLEGDFTYRKEGKVYKAGYEEGYQQGKAEERERILAIVKEQIKDCFGVWAVVLAENIKEFC